MTQDWIDIRYREFHDVPRLIVMSIDGRTIVADCPFDDEIDDYPDSYSLFELGAEAGLLLEGSWQSLRDHAIKDLGQIAVADVVFDESKRLKVQAEAFRRRL